jgi:hypothetical protein
MFISKPLTDDHIPASPDGNIADVHVTSFQTAIDNLLTAARWVTLTGRLSRQEMLMLPCPLP